MLRNLIPDLRVAFRMLRKKPAFAIAALLNLALGIGVNTAIFSVVNAVLLQPLPYTEPSQLVFIWDTARDKAEKLTYPVSAPNFRDWQENNNVFASMSAYSFDYFNLVGQDKPERLFAAYVSPNFLTTLGVTPALGRSFSSSEEQTSEVIVSNSLWKRRFASNPQLVGQPLTINGRAYNVIGVLPPEFQIPRQVSLGVVAMDDIDLLVPISVLASNEPATVNERGRHFLTAVGRVKPGIGIEQAGSAMTAIASGLSQRYPEANANFTVHLVPVHEQITGSIRPALLLLLGAVGLVLLIACSNVANLLLARYAGRQKEFAIRAALGARAGRLLQQLFTESLLLGFIGGGLGLLLAVAATRALVASNLSDIPRILHTGVDARVLGFTVLISLVTSVLFALAPTLQYIRPNLNKSLKDGERSASTAPISRRLRNVLVVTEMALALMLLVGAGLLIRSFSRILAVDMGFNPRNVLTAEVFLPPDKYSTPAQFISFHSSLMERLKNEAGVESAATVNILPLKGTRAVSIGVEGQPEPPPGQEVLVSQRIVSPAYFNAMAIPLRQGRVFTEHDTTDSPPVVVISQSLAQKFWGQENVVGKRLTMGPKASEIVGVVGDVKEASVEDATNPEVYLPYRQYPWPVFTLVLRSANDPQNLLGFVQRDVAAIDKDQPIGKSAPMEEVLADKLSQRRLNVVLLGVFGGVALLLALVGIYGVISYTVTQRTHELGLRMALGAQPHHILRLIVGQGMSLALIGIGVGLAGAFILSRYLTSMVYEISVTDPVTFVGSALLLILAAFIACYLPARKALKVYPMDALRQD
ncbi:MAG TPA: ABC transporter permease [Pyrinomonadaceae bacterium]|nr:ABC transporter permease [Pyrinomonadaceae bacterium]